MDDAIEAAEVWHVPDGILPAQLATAVARDRRTRIDLSRHPSAAPLLRALAHDVAMARVRELRLARAGLSVADVVRFAQSPHLTCLERLDVRGNALSDEGFAALCRAPMPRLRALVSSDTELTGTSLSGLTRCAWIDTIETLSLADNDFTRSAPGRRVVPVALVSLDVARSHCRARCLRGLVASGLLSGIEALVVEDFFGPAEARALGTLRRSRLARLALYGMRDMSSDRGDVLGDEGVQQLATSALVAGVTRLEITNHAVGDAGARALARSSFLGALRKLVLRDNVIGDAGARALMEGRATRELDELDLRGNRISPATAGALRSRFGAALRLD